MIHGVGSQTTRCQSERTKKRPDLSLLFAESSMKLIKVKLAMFAMFGLCRRRRLIVQQQETRASVTSPENLLPFFVTKFEKAQPKFGEHENTVPIMREFLSPRTARPSCARHAPVGFSSSVQLCTKLHGTAPFQVNQAVMA